MWEEREGIALGKCSSPSLDTLLAELQPNQSARHLNNQSINQSTNQSEYFTYIYIKYNYMHFAM